MDLQTQQYLRNLDERLSRIEESGAQGESRAFDRITSFFPQTARREKDFYTFGVEYNPLAASVQQATRQFAVDNDADFVVLSISMVLTTDVGAGTEQTFPEALMQVMDSGSGANWFNPTQHMGNVTQRMTVDGQGPWILECPRWINAASQVTVTVTNLEATDRRLWLAFHGAKIYRGMNPRGR